MSDIDELVKRLRSTRTEQGGLWPIPNLHEEAADALEAQAKRIEGLEYEAKLFDEALGVANARIKELEAALKNWDALICHQYTGSREAMSDMTVCAQETAELLYGPEPWPIVRGHAALKGEKG